MIVLWHLEEAMMQLKHLVENIDRLETPKFDAPWGKFDLIYYHLNTACNTRHFSDEAVNRISDNDEFYGHYPDGEVRAMLANYQENE